MVRTRRRSPSGEGVRAAGGGVLAVLLLAAALPAAFVAPAGGAPSPGRGPATELLSAAVDGGPADGASGSPVIRADGRVAAFASAAINLVRGDDNGRSDLFVRDLRGGVLRRVDAKAPGPEGVVTVDGVSAHGTKLLLDTYPVLTTEDAEHIRDLRTDTDVLVSPDKDGRPADAVDARMDSRARTVVFAGSDQEDFVPDDTNGVKDVFVWRNGGSRKPW